MSSPVSTFGGSGGVLILVEDALEGAVLVGLVGGVGLPALPDHVQPGAGEDADGVGVVVASGSGLLVEGCSPGVGEPGVAGEVADRVAELFVGRPAKADGADLAGLSGGGCDAGEAGQRFGGGEPGSAVADLGEQAGGADSAGAGEAGEDVLVGVAGELVVDLRGQVLDLGCQAGQDRDQGVGDAGFGVGVGAGEAARGGGQPVVQHGRVDLAGVADAGQPGGEPARRQPRSEEH